jgi:hypothetical protein
MVNEIEWSGGVFFISFFIGRTKLQEVELKDIES